MSKEFFNSNPKYLHIYGYDESPVTRGFMFIIVVTRAGAVSVSVVVLACSLALALIGRCRRVCFSVKMKINAG